MDIFQYFPMCHSNQGFRVPVKTVSKQIFQNYNFFF
jgi:hypothetical protein